MGTLKERIAAEPDMSQKDIDFNEFEGDLKSLGKITIRRFSLRERDEILKSRDTGEKDQAQAGSDLSRIVVSKGLVEPTATEEELKDLPSFLVDEIGTHIMNFNGWTVQGRRSLEDQFRAST